MGFTNVSRLAGGIIAYDRKLNEVKEKGEEVDMQQTEQSLFKGTNFVFDGRVGRQITSDALAECVTCGSETSLVSNCRNDNCHARIVQCEKCRTSFHGTCSTACRNRVVNGDMASRRVSLSNQKSVGIDQNVPIYDSIDMYVSSHSSPVPPVYKEIELNTEHYLANGAHMVSGASQGQLLKLFASMSRYGRVLECGTFTGYATARLLEGAQSVGKLGGAYADVDNAEVSNTGPYVLSLERDQRAFSIAAMHLQAIAQHGVGEEAVEVLQKLRQEDALSEVKESLVSVKTTDGLARLDLLRVNDALATVESLADNTSSFSHGEPFDIVFVDADKGRLIEYAEACLANDSLLRPGGMLIVDNTLWKGLVLEAAQNDFKSLVDDEHTTDTVARKNRRARKLATQMHIFNAAIANDPRVEVMMLPMRDGLSIIRKK
jgi:predicted O-methyltransferase YrrM